MTRRARTIAKLVQRAEAALANAALFALKAKLLEIGGHSFQVDWYLRESVTEALARALAESGKPQAGDSLKCVRGRRSQCHWNSLSYAKRNPGTVVYYGFALSEDGIWRVHAWVVAPTGTLVETTEPRVIYFGVPLRAEYLPAPPAPVYNPYAKQSDGQTT